MSADLTLVIEAVEKNTAAIARVASNLEQNSKRITSSFEKIQRAQKDTGNGTKTLAEKFRQLAIGALRRLGQGLINLAEQALRGVIRAMGEAAAKSVEFEKAIAEVFTLASGGTTTMESLSKQVKSLAGQFGGKLTTQASALYQAISAGADDGAESMKVMEVANRLAIGGVTDQETAIDGLTSVLNAFGLDMEAFSDIVAQKFFTAMRKGKTTVGELANNIGVLAPTANAAGLSLDEMFAAVSAITTGGIKTETAIISLNQALVAMLKPTKQAKEEAARLGIEFNAMVLREKGLSGFFNELLGNSKLTDESMTKLFGNVRALRAVLALSNNDGEKFAEVLEAMATNVDDADQAFDKMAATMDFTIGRMDAAGEAASESFGSIITESDSAKTSIENLTTALRGLEKIFDFAAENGAFDKFVDSVRLLALTNPATAGFAAQMELLSAGLTEIGENAEKVERRIHRWRKELAVTEKNAQHMVTELRALGVAEERIDEILEEGTRIREKRKEMIDKIAKAEIDAKEKRKKAEKQAKDEETKTLDKHQAKLDRMFDRAMKRKARKDKAAAKNIARDFKDDLKDEEKRERERQKTLKALARERKRNQDKDLRESQRVAEGIARTSSDAILSIFDVLTSKSEDKGKQIMSIITSILKRLAGNLLTGFIGSLIPGGSAIGGIGSLLFGKSGGVVPHGLMSKPVKMDTGGILRGGTQGKDSIPVMAKAGEEFLTRQDRRIVDKALSGGGGTTNQINLTVAVPNKPPTKAETYKWAAQELGPVLKQGIADGTIKLG